MAGTVNGGNQAAKTNKDIYGEDFYKRIGAIGGSRSRNGGFAQGKEGRERARLYGGIGGAMSRRNKSLTDEQRLEIKLAAIKRQASRTTGETRARLRKQARELSEMQTSKLSERYGVRKTW